MSTLLARRSTLARRLAPALLATLAIAACGSDEPSSSGEQVTDERDGDTAEAATTSTTTTTLAVGGGAGAGETATTAAPETTEPPPIETTTTTTTTTTEPPPPDPSGCIVGQWSLQSQAFLDEIAGSLPADAIGDGPISWNYVSGEYLFDFNADGTSRGQRIAWTHRLEAEGGALITTIDSDDSGTWAVEGDTLSISDSASEATVTVGVEIGGAVQPLPGGTQQVGTDGVSGSGTFTCSDSTLTITLVDFPDAPPAGFTVVMDRR